MGKCGLILCAAVTAALTAGYASASRTGDKSKDTWGPPSQNNGDALGATTITFDEGVVVPGAILSNQYLASHGVSFSAGSGGAAGVPQPPNGQFEATNTAMDISTVAIEAANGVGAPLAGNVLHSSAGWLVEDGNPMFTMTFTAPITDIGADFGANFFSDSALCAVNAANQVIATAFMGPGVNDHAQLNLPAGTSVSKVVVVIGAFDDYVAMDNISFTNVPEPAALSLLALGGLPLARRRRH